MKAQDIISVNADITLEPWQRVIAKSIIEVQNPGSEQNFILNKLVLRVKANNSDKATLALYADISDARLDVLLETNLVQKPYQVGLEHVVKNPGSLYKQLLASKAFIFDYPQKSADPYISIANTFFYNARMDIRECIEEIITVSAKNKALAQQALKSFKSDIIKSVTSDTGEYDAAQQILHPIKNLTVNIEKYEEAYKQEVVNKPIIDNTSYGFGIYQIPYLAQNLINWDELE